MRKPIAVCFLVSEKPIYYTVCLFTIMDIGSILVSSLNVSNKFLTKQRHAKVSMIDDMLC